MLIHPRFRLETSVTAPRLVVVVSAILALLAAPLAAAAQPAGKVPRIGALSAFNPGDPVIESFRQGLRDLGYVEGRNITVEYRYAEGKAERYGDLAAEVVRLEPDVIVVWGTEFAQAVQRATSAIPVVFAVADGPVEMGLVQSLARPGGNVTGLTTLNFELSAKRLELLKEALPKLTRVAVLYSPDPRVAPTLKKMAVAARALGFRLQPLEVRGPEDLDRAFAEMTKERAGAFVELPSPVLIAHRTRVVDLALKRRLPAISGGRGSGWSLMGYGPNTADMARRAATLVDKILKGAKPADLPVEQPTRFNLVVNRKAAKALGLTIPQSVLLRADELIQ